MNIDEILKESSDSIEIDDLESVKMYENIKSKCLKQKTQRKENTFIYFISNYMYSNYSISATIDNIIWKF